MKDIFKIFIMAILVILVFIYRENIADFVNQNIIYHGSSKVLTYNEYYINKDYSYVQNIDTNKVNNYQEILNMFYSIINSGDDSFSFYCNYNNCIKDVEKITKDNYIIPNINNFVHPYNSYYSINIDIKQTGRITVTSKKTYSEEQIKFINKYIEDFINNNITESMTDYDKIKLFHDEVINNTIYDEDNKDKIYNAYYLITTGKAICGGYSDIMAIYLNKLEIQNYKITSENHVWNLVNLDGVWMHIDTTWDDPIASDGKQYLIHNFFLISTKDLQELDKLEHNFDLNVYKEAS